MIEGSLLRFKNKDYLINLKALGIKNSTIILKHILILTARQIIILAFYNAASSIFISTTLGFLGVGLENSNLEWGSLIKDSWNYILVHPWPFVFYSLNAILVSFFLNYLGEYFKNKLLIST
jgi:ABC-type dipeptide/oligopeptide/nickel transport system permease subunit